MKTFVAKWFIALHTFFNIVRCRYFEQFAQMNRLFISESGPFDSGHCYLTKLIESVRDLDSFGERT